MSFALLDLGGTFIKCRLDDSDKEVRIKFPPFIKNRNPKVREVDPNELLKSVFTILDEVISTSKKVDGILISGQMHGWVLTDQEFNPLTNIVTWQDSRSQIEDNFYDNLIENFSSIDVQDCGNEVKPGSPIAGIAFTLSKLDIKNFKITSLLSWVAAHLVEIKTNIMHKTDAAAFSCLDVKHLNWNRNMISVAGIQNESLPKVSHNLEVIGNSGQYNCSVFTPVGDYQASLFGVELNSDEISINLATGGQVSKLISRHEYSKFQVRPYFGDQFLQTKTHLPAGRHANYVLSKFRKGEIDDNWEFLTNLNFVNSYISLKNIDNEFDIEKEYNSSSITTFQDEAELILYFTSIIMKYIDVVKIFSEKENTKIIGSGGLISNSKFIREAFEFLGDFRFERIIVGEDAALKGLERLTKII
jgi:xylulokinase